MGETKCIVGDGILAPFQLMLLVVCMIRVQ